MSSDVPAMWMRGGTSKGLYFLKNDLPSNKVERDEFLLSIFGSPDKLQINGIGGGNPLTSKVAIVSKSKKPDVDIDYLFLQVSVDNTLVSDTQNCGNILAGIAPFAIERGLVKPKYGHDETSVKIYMKNTKQMAIATVQTPKGEITYKGETYIDGVPKSSSPISLEFLNIAGSLCGDLLPTGNQIDKVNGIEVTMIDNGMPCVIIRAIDLNITGYENIADLESNLELRNFLEKLRISCGKLMKLGDVAEKTVPKMTIVSNAKSEGIINTRTFIPHRCHSSIGVFGAISVATACLLDKSIANQISSIPDGNTKICSIEHPSGQTQVVTKTNQQEIISTAILRTARKLFDGIVYDDIY
jgi:4-oxalomesaconate tautomerase